MRVLALHLLHHISIDAAILLRQLGGFEQSLCARPFFHPSLFFFSFFILHDLDDAHLASNTHLWFLEVVGKLL